MIEDEKKPPPVLEQIAQPEPEPQSASDLTASPSLEDDIAGFESLLADLAVVRDADTSIEHMSIEAFREALKKAGQT